MENNMENHENEILEVMQHNRRFIAWKCESVREGMKPFGRSETPACGFWSVKATKSNNKHLQANCKNPACKRRARLNANTRKFYEYDTKEAAERHCEALNREAGRFDQEHAPSAQEAHHNLQEMEVVE